MGKIVGVGRARGAERGSDHRARRRLTGRVLLRVPGLPNGAIIESTRAGVSAAPAHEEERERMSGLSLNLGENEMRAIVAEAIVAKLDEAARRDLIQQAVAKMLVPERQGYGSRATEQSWLHMAFENAVRNLTYEVAREYIESHPEVRQQIEDALGAALVKLTQGNRSIRAAVAESVASALESKLNDD